MHPLAQQLISRMPELTTRYSIGKALANAKDNLPDGHSTIADLKRLRGGTKQSALVIGAGPSLHRRNSVARILESGYDGYIVAADGALPSCLRQGLVPDFVVTLDPHSARICRWFGDPDLERREDDGYFRRQDLDPYLRTDELRRNRELIELVTIIGYYCLVSLTLNAFEISLPNTMTDPFPDLS